MIQDVGDKCCGCTACATVCPVQCISMGKDFLGFAKPTVDETQCVQCGKCRQVCPAIEVKNPHEPLSAKCGWTTDADARSRSSSGGSFPALASPLMAEGGVVYGAVFDRETKRIVHRSTEDVDLHDIQGSKYVQSDLGNTLRHVQRDLMAGKTVLFVGTPCQVNGLKNLVGEDYENLLTCDFVCHGVSSPLVFAEYLAERERRYRSRAVFVNFRDKSRGWTKSSTRIVFSSGKDYCRRNRFDMFFRGFVDSIYHNMSCYHCWHNRNRSSDITFADFWHYELLDERLNDEKGLSLVICNNERGVKWFDRASAFQFHHVDVPLTVALIGNDEGEKARVRALKNRDEFASIARQANISAACQRLVGSSMMGMAVRKLARIGCRRLLSRFFRGQHG